MHYLTVNMEGITKVDGVESCRVWMEGKMQSARALPTCYRILYYYADFPVIPSFINERRRGRKRKRERL